jgi:catechol 2,3-dioxygenase-like lactoylglutathione lyase family enzyme
LIPGDSSLEVGIVVRDLEATTSFYGDALGLKHVADLPLPLGLQRRFACGGGIVKLMQLDTAPTTSNPPGGITGGSTGLRWFTFKVTNIEEVVDRCLAAGGRVASPLVEWQPGRKVVVVEDPEGSCWIELSERTDDRRE